MTQKLSPFPRHNMHLLIKPDMQLAGSPSLALKRGDCLDLTLTFLDHDGSPCDPGLADITFGAKPPGQYSGPLTILAHPFTPDTDAQGRPCYTALLKLNTTALADLIGDALSIDLDAELTFARRYRQHTTRTLRLRINNDIIKNTEPLDPDTALEFVTKQYMDNTIPAQIAEAMQLLGTLPGITLISEQNYLNLPAKRPNQIYAIIP